MLKDVFCRVFGHRWTEVVWPAAGGQASAVECSHCGHVAAVALPGESAS